MNLNTKAPINKKTVTASACMNAAMRTDALEKFFKADELNAAADLKIANIRDIFAAFGIYFDANSSTRAVPALQAAFSNTDIPDVLSNVSQKFMLSGFGAVGEEWRKIIRPVPVMNFKKAKAVRLVAGGVLQSLGKGGELKHVTLDDEARELQAETKGAIVGITREDLINDDLGVLAAMPTKFGMMAGRTINRDVFGALSKTAADYGASTTGVLNFDNLSTAYGLAAQIKDSEGNFLGALPNKILCSPVNYLGAKSIYLSEFVTGAQTTTGKQNVLRGMFEPISSPYLGNGTEYWLFNDVFPLVDVAFLGGRQEPQVETAAADFNQLGIQMRCYYDYAAAPGELKAALYSTCANA